jgi:hypothetical protein
METKTSEPKTVQQDKEGQEGLFELATLAHAVGLDKMILNYFSPNLKQAGLDPEAVLTGVTNFTKTDDKLAATVSTHTSQLTALQETFGKLIDALEKRLKTLETAKADTTKRLETLEKGKTPEEKKAEIQAALKTVREEYVVLMASRSNPLCCLFSWCF